MKIKSTILSLNHRLFRALRSWEETEDPGQPTVIIPLNEPRVTEKVSFGDIHYN